MPGTEQIFTCPYCGQQFPWKPQYAGRKLACACGNLLDLQAPPEPDTYDLKDEPAPVAKRVQARGTQVEYQGVAVTPVPTRVEPLDEPPPGQLTLDSTGQEIPQAKPVKPPKVLDYRRLGSAEQRGASDDTRSRRRDLWIPLGMIAISLPLLILLAYFMDASPSRVAFELGMRIIWDLAMTLLAGLVIYWTIDTGLGEFPTAILKLLAIGLFRFSVSAIIQPDGNILLAMGGFLLTFPILLYLFSYLFEFDFTELLFCSVILSFMRLISYFGLWKILE